MAQKMKLKAFTRVHLWFLSRLSLQNSKFSMQISTRQSAARARGSTPPPQHEKQPIKISDKKKRNSIGVQEDSFVGAETVSLFKKGRRSGNITEAQNEEFNFVEQCERVPVVDETLFLEKEDTRSVVDTNKLLVKRRVKPKARLYATKQAYKDVQQVENVRVGTGTKVLTPVNKAKKVVSFGDRIFGNLDVHGEEFDDSDFPRDGYPSADEVQISQESPSDVPSIESFFVDTAGFERSCIESGFWVKSPLVSYGYCVGVFSKSGILHAVYQNIGEDIMERVFIFESAAFPPFGACPVNVNFDFLLVTQVGYTQFVKMGVVFAVPFVAPEGSKQVRTNDISAMFSGCSSSMDGPYVNTQSQEGFGSRFPRDMSSVGMVAQAKFNEYSPFRVMCGNKRSIWEELAGELCVLDAYSTSKNVLVGVSPKLMGLPVLSAYVLPSLLCFNFRASDYLVSYVEPTKRSEHFSLGHLLLRGEELRSVRFVELVVQRLCTLLGMISHLPSAWKEIFRPLMDVLSSREEQTVESWAVVHVIKVVNQKFTKLAWFMSQRSTTLLVDDEFVKRMQEVLVFDFPKELSIYLASSDYALKLIATKPRGVGGGGGTPYKKPWLEQKAESNVVSATGVAKPGGVELWCIAAAAHSLGVRDTECNKGSACRFTHAKLNKPFTPKVKENLLALAKNIKNVDFKGKFIAACA